MFYTILIFKLAHKDSHFGNVFLFEKLYFITMKNKFLIMAILLTFSIQCYAMTVYQGNPFTGPVYNGYNGINSSYNNYRPTYNVLNNRYNNYNRYNPYNNYRYTNPWGYNTLNSNQIKTLNKIRQRNRIKNNIFSFLNNKLNNNGYLTGYSTPITSSALDLTPQNDVYSPTNQMKLFQSPQNGQEFYFNDGRFYKDLHDIDSKTGVTIIKD